jgi:hypothetical protein
MTSAVPCRTSRREEPTMDMVPQSYPLVVTIDDTQHLVIGWTRLEAGPGAAALAPVTVPLAGPGRPEARPDDEFDYTLPPGRIE